MNIDEAVKAIEAIMAYRGDARSEGKLRTILQYYGYSMKFETLANVLEPIKDWGTK